MSDDPSSPDAVARSMGLGGDLPRLLGVIAALGILGADELAG